MTYKEENIVNIAMKAAELLLSEKIQTDDISGHMGLTESIIAMAEDFEEKCVHEDYESGTRDYWEDIDRYAEEQLLDRYGIEQERPSLLITEKDQSFTEKMNDNHIQLWARVGMTLRVPESTYERLKAGDRQALQDVFDGKAGHVVLDGETYFPDIEQNVGLEEAEFDLSVSQEPTAPDLSKIENSDPVKVYAVAGQVRLEIYSGTLSECKGFCNASNWVYTDKNRFEWALELEDSRKRPSGYEDALAFYNRAMGTDIENDHIVEHADELVYCHEHQKGIIDFDFWTSYEDLLGEKLSYEEYCHIDRFHDGDPLELDSSDTAVIHELKSQLSQYRKEFSVKEPDSLADKILAAKSRQDMTELSSKNAVLRYDTKDTIVTFDNYRGGVNNLTTCRTNPVGRSPFPLTKDTVITSGTGDTEQVMKRHRQKLSQINRRNEKEYNPDLER